MISCQTFQEGFNSNGGSFFTVFIKMDEFFPLSVRGLVYLIEFRFSEMFAIEKN